MKLMKKWVFVTGAGMAAATGAAQMVNAQDFGLEDQWSLLDKYCMECHSFDEFRGGLALEGLGPQDIHENAGIFEEVLRKMKISAMPPREQPQPSRQERTRFVSALEQTLDAAAMADPYAGTTTIHRLNRAEYTNAIRDLLGVNIDLTEMLPSDGGDFGFDNIADLLRTSPMLLARCRVWLKAISVSRVTTSRMNSWSTSTGRSSIPVR